MQPCAMAVHGCLRAPSALGLSNQVPAKTIILTDGVSRKVSLGKLTLIFHRAAQFAGGWRRAGLAIQALRCLKDSPDLTKHVTRFKCDMDTE